MTWKYGVWHSSNTMMLLYDDDDSVVTHTSITSHSSPGHPKYRVFFNLSRIRTQVTVRASLVLYNTRPKWNFYPLILIGSELFPILTIKFYPLISGKSDTRNNLTHQKKETIPEESWIWILNTKIELCFYILDESLLDWSAARRARNCVAFRVRNLQKSLFLFCLTSHT